MGDYRYFPDQPAPPPGYDARGQRPGPAWDQPQMRQAPVPPVPPVQFVRHGQAPIQQTRAPHPGAVPPSPPLRRAAPQPDWDQGAYGHPGGYAAPPPVLGHGYAPVPDHDAPYPDYDMPQQAYAPPPHPPRAPHVVAPPVWGADPAMAPPAWVGPQAQGRAAPQPAAPSTPPIQAATLLHGLGAVLSLGLVVLAGGWTWNMMQRDVSGVPVVRALEGPMRVAPENPGGQQAAFQGLAVNQLAGSGQTTEAETIVLAPPPVGLSDMTGQPAQVQPPLGPGVTELAQTELGFRTPNASAVERSPRPRGRDTAALPLEQFAAAPVAAQVAAPITAPAALPVAPSLSTSNDPRAADALAASIAQSVAVGLTSTGGRDIDPASIGPGTRLVQLGAYDTPEEARAAWDRLSARFNPLLQDRARVIEAAHSGGSVFYRLRAHGFSDERDARRFCAALVAEQLDCIPVLVR